MIFLFITECLGALKPDVLPPSHTSLQVHLKAGEQYRDRLRGAFCSTLLRLALLGAAGSTARERTCSIRLGMIAGLWCGSLGAMIRRAPIGSEESREFSLPSNRLPSHPGGPYTVLA